MPTAVSAQNPNRRPRCLVVDDYFHLRKFLRNQLDATGCDTGEAPFGDFALATLRTGYYDFVVTGYSHNEAARIDFFNRLQENATLKQLPIFVTTGTRSDDHLGVKASNITLICVTKKLLQDVVQDIMQRYTAR